MAIGSIVFLDRKALKEKHVLSWGTLLFFIFMLIFGVFMHHPWVMKNAYWFSTLVLAGIMLVSVLIKKPFSLVYARENCPEKYWDSPLFLEVNILISLCWFAGMLIATYGCVSHGLKNVALQVMGFALPLFITILLPERYSHFRMARGGVAQIHGISEVKKLHGIGYREIGQGEPLILLAGSNMTLHHWNPELITRLSPHFRCILADIPGVGVSPTDTVPQSVEEAAKSMLPFMAEVADTKPFLFGFSMGGFIAQAIADKVPEKLAGLILVSTAPGQNAVAMSDADLNLLTDTSGTMEDHFKRMGQLTFPDAETGRRLGKKVGRIYISAALEGELSETEIAYQNRLCENWSQVPRPCSNLATLAVPMLIMTGTMDRICPPENARRLHAACPHSLLKEFNHAGHGLIYQCPSEIVEEIKQAVLD
ncbi:alpha/beta fold hydrolase [Desulforhopalus vacuolatus]|uniref:alpha/beta fold hydrolase n=1 Tax=Desulforhopalus vacuolatus TaxID=40414 RepID=UPI0019642799|nr:alpha/beta fold hydrolase [Desulforhopalus vacuolatus]MBM9521041.1 alpha/beta fold hydrolase [Desulforhopalus vacuolatus]